MLKSSDHYAIQLETAIDLSKEITEAIRQMPAHSTGWFYVLLMAELNRRLASLLRSIEGRR
jgi:hypothetical protein